MRAAIYARVSTDKQELENQLLKLRQLCQHRNWPIAAEYCDIISGSKDSRPEWDHMFLDARAAKFDILVFYSLDRFSRSGTLYTLQRLKELEILGIAWFSLSEQYLDTAGPFKEVVISIMASLAKIEREKISERTKAGLARTKNKHKIGKRGPDKKRRRTRSDIGKKRGVRKNHP